jgi:glycerate dehydrogenase
VKEKGKYKIVIADGYTLNPGDLDWKGIGQYGDVAYYDRTPAAEMIARCKDADIIITNKAPIDAGLFEQAERLKLVLVTATGYNIVDVAAAKRRGVTVCNVPDYGTASVAQHTFACILELANLVGANSQAVASGEWVASPDFAFSKGPLTELQGKTLGIIGLGRIGSQVARLAQAFDMRVLYHSRKPKPGANAEYVPLTELVTESDIVSLHCPLTKENTRFINRSLLQQMKRSAWLINTSRGALIEEHDLAEALKNGTIAHAALDVLSVEPPTNDNPLLTAPNCLITPHNAWLSLEARTRILRVTESNLSHFVRNAPINTV